MILLVDCPHEEKSWGGRVLTWGTEGGEGGQGMEAGPVHFLVGDSSGGQP